MHARNRSGHRFAKVRSRVAEDFLEGAAGGAVGAGRLPVDPLEAPPPVLDAGVVVPTVVEPPVAVGCAQRHVSEPLLADLLRVLLRRRSSGKMQESSQTFKHSILIVTPNKSDAKPLK